MPLSKTVAPVRLTPKNVASEPGELPATNEAAFTTAPITGAALPAFSVRVTVGAASTESLSWLTAPSRGAHWKQAKPAASAVATAGVTLPLVVAAAMRAPGYGSPLTSVNCTAANPGKGLRASRGVSCEGAAACTRAKATS